MGKKKYTVVFPVNHDGEKFKPGDAITLEEAQAESLLRRGTLSKGKAIDPNPGLEEPKIGEAKPPEGAATQLTQDPATQTPGE